MSKQESIYLHDIPLDQAWAVWVKALETAGLWRALGSEEISLDRALGRVTSNAIWAKISSPSYHAAAMDGFALRAAQTSGASDRNPVTLQIGSDAVYVDTGDPMPGWANAVVPIENIEPLGDSVDLRSPEAIRLRAAVAPWTHVRSMGEDMIATELVLPAGHTLRPVDLGAIAGSGYETVHVQRRPRVAIIPTGSELVPPGADVQLGGIIEYNSLVLAAQIESWGGTATRFPIVPDDIELIKQSTREAAADHDLVLINAGSSAGAEDFTAKVVEKLGTLLVHGVAVRPGHPVILGMIDGHLITETMKQTKNGDKEKGKSKQRTHTQVPVIGVPGYPVSAALTGEIFVEPLIARWLGQPPARPQILQARLTRKVHSSLGDDEYLRVTVGRVGERMVAAPLTRGAGVITSLVRADGIVLIPSGVQGLAAGEIVDVRLYRPLSDIERTILVLGSHDLTIDLIAQYLAEHGVRVSSANLGSVGGLIALQRREAHLAGCHLLDPISGEYNLAYIEQYIPNIPVVVLGYVHRDQGLILQRENPKELCGMEDLVRSDVTFVNRQRGAGTRILLDYHLDELEIPAEAVRGYDREEYTHLALAAAVASGVADCGLGIQAAAEALGLDFIPLFKERYDLVIPIEYYESPLLAPLLAILNDEDFQEAVDALAGYDTKPMGSVIACLG